MSEQLTNLEQTIDDNTGGIESCWYVPVEHVLLVPPMLGEAIDEDIELVDLATWFQVVAVQNSIRFQQPGKSDRYGDFFQPKLTGTLAKNTAGLAAGISAVRGRRYLVLYRDQNGLVWLLGDLDEGLQWQDTFSAGTVTQLNGYDWQFFGETTLPARRYAGSWTVANGSIESGESTDGGPVTNPGGGTANLRTFTATNSVGEVQAGEEVTVRDDETGRTTEEMLTKDSPAQATLQASSPVRQKGAPTAVTLTFSVTEGTYAITSVVVAGEPQTYTDGSVKLAGAVSVATAANTDTTFALVATDAQGGQAQASAGVQYRQRRYWGGMVQDPLSLDDVQLSAVLRTLSHEFSTSRSQDFSLALSDQYAVVARPASQGVGAYNVNGLANNAFEHRFFPFTNSDGFVEQYVVERSATPDTGNFNIKIS